MPTGMLANTGFSVFSIEFKTNGEIVRQKSTHKFDSANIIGSSGLSVMLLRIAFSAYE